MDRDAAVAAAARADEAAAALQQTLHEQQQRMRDAVATEAALRAELARQVQLSCRVAPADLSPCASLPCRL
jgi:hypothetical protein